VDRVREPKWDTILASGMRAEAGTPLRCRCPVRTSLGRVCSRSTGRPAAEKCPAWWPSSRVLLMVFSRWSMQPEAAMRHEPRRGLEEHAAEAVVSFETMVLLTIATSVVLQRGPPARPNRDVSR